MAISFVNSAVPAANPTTSFTITIPTVNTGDDLFVVATSRDHTAGTALATCTDNDSGGNTWTLITNSTDRKAYLFWKKATSATSAKTITFGGAVGSSSGVLKVFRGCVSGNPVVGTTLETNASGNETHAGITPGLAGMTLCASVHNYANDNAVTSLSSATNGAFTTTEKLSTGGSDCATAFGHDLAVASTSTGNITWSQTDGTTYSIVWALSPLVGVATLVGWRWRNNDGDEATATWLAAENTDPQTAPSVLISSSVWRLRIELQYSVLAESASLTGECRINGGTWETLDHGPEWFFGITGNLVGGTALVNRLTGGTGTFGTDSVAVDDDTDPGIMNPAAATDHVEFELVLDTGGSISSAGETVEFRFYRDAVLISSSVGTPIWTLVNVTRTPTSRQYPQLLAH